jgi:hypothetical protein
VFIKEGSDFDLYKDHKGVFWSIMAAIGLSMILLLLHALRTSSGKTWLAVVGDFISSAWTSQASAAVLFVIGIVLFMYFITRPSGGSSSKKKEGE